MLRFICDEMLVALGKWLRIAGYDTAILDPRTSDQEILQIALEEERLLLTRDRHFQKMKEAKKVLVFLGNNSLDDCAIELRERVKLNWIYRPFTRCVQCNSLLEETNDQTLWGRVPSDVGHFSKIWHCPHCDKVYWQGSHTDKMIIQLQSWQNPEQSSRQI